MCYVTPPDYATVKLSDVKKEKTPAVHSYELCDYLLSFLEMLHIPAQALSLIIAVERLLNMCRTPTSVFTCSCSTLLVALSEGERPAYSIDIAPKSITPSANNQKK